MVKSRLTRIVLIAAIACCVAPSAVDAAPAHKQDELLTATWKTVLETPDAENPFGSGGLDFACIDLGHALTPFGPNGVESCTLETGTALFVIGSSVECSSFEGAGTTDAELRQCAREGDLALAPSVTFQGHALRLTEVETPLVEATAPAGNLFGVAAGTKGTFVAHGWVALLNPLPPGHYEVTIDDGTKPPITTSITVRPGRKR